MIISRIKWLPGSFDVTMASLIFLWFGSRTKKIHFERQPRRNALIAFTVWSATLAASLLLKGSYLELATRKYPLFPLCYATAAAGSLFVMLCSMMLVSHKKAAVPLIWLGRHSMTLYCVHSMDYLLSSLWNLSGNGFLNGSVRLCLDTAVSILIVSLAAALRKRREFENNRL